MRHVASLLALAGMVGLAGAMPHAQGRGGGRGQPPPTPKAAAPFDLTGYWTAVVTRDWRFRMVVPPKGDYAGVPLNAAARTVADAWDPARDEAAGEQCRSYGAANIMRVPGRLHITWQDDQTLKIDTDAGTQTRVFSFAAAPTPTPAAGGTWQGTSAAQWEVLAGLRGQAPLTGGRERVVCARGTRRASIRERLPRTEHMTIQTLDVVVLTRDMPAQGLRRGDLGAVVERYGVDAIGVEFVAASGRTQALVTLRPEDVRAVADDDVVAVRPAVPA